jgi:hypothetical protein
VFDAAVPGSFQDVQKPHDIRIDIVQWVLRRLANAGLSGEIDHAPRLVWAEDPCDRGLFGQFTLFEMKIRVTEAS